MFGLLEVRASERRMDRLFHDIIDVIVIIVIEYIQYVQHGLSIVDTLPSDSLKSVQYVQ